MINYTNLLKYSILFLVVTISTFYIPNCNIINEHSVYIGLLAATTFVLLDRLFPNVIGINENNYDKTYTQEKK
jgi:hypothetical protein